MNLDEYRRRRPPPVATPRDTTRLQAMVQESVRIEALTSDENWDHFLRYIESAIKLAERARDNEMDRLRDPALVNDDAVRAVRMAIAQFDSRIATLREVLMVPRLLKDHGATARAQLEDLAQGA